ncbi:recombinase family protein [Rhodococcus kroppenstedtii]|uniref:recombinase family protein n=1 Tax=Rhodococcoides kroppenstedtii TaxID=293050 RepID=UPI002954298A|nr:recombinase family protein [Rhodococcus kroppenstedtii]MDV7198105.1 recombinase family protein [Rhodococcus kroppenstedtii]
MRAAVYLRQSMDRAGNEYGIDRQRQDVMRLVEARGWAVVETFVDNDVSATARKPRPAFERMLTAAEAGAFDVIVARHLDRLLRRLTELERILAMYETTGVSVITSNDSIDTATDGGRLNARIMASVGQQEVERKSARQKSATSQAAAQGRWVGGRRPFGYEADGRTVRETEADAIRAGYAAALAGEPLTAIAREWNRLGHHTTQPRLDGTPREWTRNGVRDVLLNPRNAGLRRHRPTGAQGEFRKAPDAFVVGRAEWPPIVEEDTWRAAARVLVDPSRRRAPANAAALLTGVGLCGVCGATVHTGGARRGVRAYRCSESAHLQRQADPIEEYVEAVMVERLSRPDALAVFAPEVEADTRDLGSEADTLRRRLDDLAVDYADGALTRTQFRTANDRVRSRLAEIEADMANAGAANLVAPLVTGGDVAAAWADLSTDRKRAVVDALAVVTLRTVGRGRHRFTPEAFAETVEVAWRTDTGHALSSGATGSEG